VKLLDFVIVKLTICLVLGILLAQLTDISLTGSVIITAILIVFLSIAYVLSKPLFTRNIWFGTIAFLTMVSLGVNIEKLHDQKLHKNHYTAYSNHLNETPSLIKLKVSNLLKSNTYNDRYVVKLLKIDSISVNGLALLNLKKDSLSSAFEVDDVLFVKTSLLPIKSPINPGQFNYKSFLENKYIYSQMYGTYQETFVVSKEKHTLFGYANALRAHINQELKKYPFKPNERAIINALLLGQRNDISKEIYEDYKNSGAVHILAVSGLHVGIILLFLNMLFKPVGLLKHGRVYKIILIILCLWGFAVITGLSASVTRAALMFSLVAISLNYKRPTNTLNILACSAFIILLFKPNILFDVGFQLSYLAVIAIVTIYPLLYSFWQPKYWVVDKLWQAFIVSIAAQFGVLPISLYYFHQIPGLFFLSNVIVIPFLGVILAYGIAVIVLALCNILPNFVALFYGKIIGWMNQFFRWISQQEAFLFKDIAFNLLQVLTSYAIIVSIYHVYKHKDYKNLRMLLVAIILFQSASLYTKYQTKTDSKWIVFHKSQSSILGFQENGILQVHHSLDSTKLLNETMLVNYATKHHISEIKQEDILPLYRLNKKLLLIIDSLGVYQVSSFKPELVLLRDSPKINLVRLIDSLSPKLIIADGSNYKSYVMRWEATCKNKKVPFHHTYKKGAFVVNLKGD
jgi:competence protein ComEC